MVNSATGDAASASILTIVSTGPGRASPSADSVPPSRMAQGSGLVAAPRSARVTACPAPVSLGASGSGCDCASAMHSELVTNRSTSKVGITGPAAVGPSNATSSGTPMKPVLGKAATSAPKAASFSGTRADQVAAMVKKTISSAASRYTPMTTGSINCATGSPMPKRSSMLGSAKNSTKLLSPGIDDSGSQRRCAATYPASTSAKNGIVTARIGCIGSAVSPQWRVACVATWSASSSSSQGLARIRLWLRPALRAFTSAPRT